MNNIPTTEERFSNGTQVVEIRLTTTESIESKEVFLVS